MLIQKKYWRKILLAQNAIIQYKNYCENGVKNIMRKKISLLTVTEYYAVNKNTT
jgi:hypothetical protein